MRETHKPIGFGYWRAGEVSPLTRAGPPAVEDRRLHLHHRLAALVHHLARELHHAAVRLRGLLLLDHFLQHADGVAVLGRQQDAPLVDLQEREQRAVVDAARVLQPAGDAVDQRPVRDDLAEGRRLRVLVVGVHLVEVTREAGEVDDVGRGHGARRGLQFLPDLEVFEKHAACAHLPS